MSKWFLRGLVFAGLMVVVRLIQGVLINTFESQAGLISLALVALFLVPVLLWVWPTAGPTPGPTPIRTAARTWP